MVDVRHIASGARGDLFVTGAFECDVTVWSLAARRQLADFRTVLDFGGERLALCEPDGEPVVVAGSWERNVISAYARDGECLWQRKDLTRVQQLTWAGQGELVAACFEDTPMRLLDARSGQSYAEVNAVKRFAQSPYGERGGAELSGHAAMVDTSTWATLWKRPLTGFGILDMAHAPGALVASDVAAGGGPPSGLWCFDSRGDLLWHWHASAEANCPSLAWDDAANEWMGILRHADHGVPDALLRWSIDGDVVLHRPLGEKFAEFEFPIGGRHLITDQCIFDTVNGQPAWNYQS